MSTASNPVIERLVAEHRSLAALIRELERVAKQSGPLAAGDYCLMRDIVAYVHDYTDTVHHPTEDLVFARLLALRPAVKAMVSRLRRDHVAVARETRTLFEQLDRIALKRASGRQTAVLKACDEYVAHQRAHMQRENKEFFPAAMRWLTAADWRAIAANFLIADDPLFGRIVSRKHRVLYEYLLDPEAMNARPGGARNWLSPQAHLRTAEILYQSGGECLARVFAFWDTVGAQTWETCAGRLRPETLSDALAMPVACATSLGSSASACGRDLLRISQATAKKTLANYSSQNPLGA